MVALYDSTKYWFSAPRQALHVPITHHDPEELDDCRKLETGTGKPSYSERNGRLFLQTIIDVRKFSLDIVRPVIIPGFLPYLNLIDWKETMGELPATHHECNMKCIQKNDM